MRSCAPILCFLCHHRRCHYHKELHLEGQLQKDEENNRKDALNQLKQFYEREKNSGATQFLLKYSNAQDNKDQRDNLDNGENTENKNNGDNREKGNYRQDNRDYWNNRHYSDNQEIETINQNNKFIKHYLITLRN